jgi:predicted phosphate transport protein (TIGR00153 family)
MSTYLTNLFGRSPIGPLEHHMAKAHACASELIPFFDAALAGDWDKAAEIQKHISNLENEADDLKKDLRLHMPKGLFMPVARRDLLQVLTMQDRVANQAKDIAGIILGRHMTFPESMGPRMRDFVKRAVDASAQANKAIHELDELLETGFRGSEVELVETMIKELDAIERDTDKIEVEVRAALFAMEKDLPPVDVMFLYQVITGIGELGDIAQRVGSRLQLLLAR